MKTSNQKVLWGFEPFDYRASEAYLERMSRRGRKLESVSGYIAEFSRCEPGERVYRADVFAEEFADNGKKKRDAYINRWAKAGWELCAQSDYLYYFCREGTDKSLPAGVRPQEKELLRVAIWRREFYAILVMVLVLAFGLICQTRMTYLSLLTYTDFCKTSLFLVFVVPCAAILLYHLFFYILRRAVIKRGELLPVPSLAAARVRSALIYSITVLFVLYVLFSFIADAFTGYARVMLLTAPLVLAVGVAWIVRRIRAKRKKGSLLAGVLIILAISVTITFVSTVNLDNASNELPEGSYALHVSDLDEALTPQRVSYTHTQSPVVRRHYVYVETAADGTKVSTEYILCAGEWSADLMYRLVVEALADIDPEAYTLTRNGNEIIYCEPAIVE